MAQVGWIKLHRKIWECDIWKDTEPFNKRSAWIDMILLANHETKNVVIGMQTVKVDRGCFVTSQDHLAERWHWGRHKVRNFLNLLIKCNMIVLKTANKYSYINIVNYCIYNDMETINGPAKEQQRANNGTSKEQQRATNKNDKNIKNDKENTTDVVVVSKDISKGSSYSPLDDVQKTLGIFPSSFQSECLKALYEEVGEVFFHKALEKAAKANVKNIKYVETVARGLAAGNDFDEKSNTKPGGIDWDAMRKKYQEEEREN